MTKIIFDYRNNIILYLKISAKCEYNFFLNASIMYLIYTIIFKYI